MSKQLANSRTATLDDELVDALHLLDQGLAVSGDGLLHFLEKCVGSWHGERELGVGFSFAGLRKGREVGER